MMLWNINMINKLFIIIFCCKEILYYIFFSGMYRKYDKLNVLKICEYG